jgi:type II secretory pathway component PulC
MSKKQLQLVLIIIVSIIWGIIAFNLIATFMDKNDALDKTITKNEQFKDNNIKIDSFRLQLNYRDPFLKSNFENEKSGISATKLGDSKKHAPTIAHKEINIPNISYKGMIWSEMKRTATIVHDRKMYFMRKNDLLANHKIIEIYPDSMQLEVNGKIVVIRKK